MTTEGSGASRGGGEGVHNEDAFVVDAGLGLYLVCDGASASPAGEVAARATAEALEAFVDHAERRLELASEPVARAVVERAMTHALAGLAEAERGGPARGSRTTVTMLLAHGRHGVIGHRGDSRAYLIRRGRAHQLTVDQELTEALPRDGDFEVFAVDLEPRDTVVLCTDGAEAVVEDRSIARVAAELTPPLLASRIVSAAHRRSPEVDATAVVVRLRGERDRGWLELSGEPRGTAFGHTLPQLGS